MESIHGRDGKEKFKMGKSQLGQHSSSLEHKIEHNKGTFPLIITSVNASHDGGVERLSVGWKVPCRSHGEREIKEGTVIRSAGVDDHERCFIHHYRYRLFGLTTVAKTLSDKDDM